MKKIIAFIALGMFLITGYAYSLDNDTLRIPSKFEEKDGFEKIEADKGLIIATNPFMVWLVHCRWDKRRDLNKGLFVGLLNEKDIDIYTIVDLERNWGIAGFYTVGNPEENGKIAICIDKDYENDREFIEHLAQELGALHSYLERVSLIHGLPAISEWLNDRKNNSDIQNIIENHQAPMSPNQAYNGLTEGFLQVENIPVGEGYERAFDILKNFILADQNRHTL